jgi:hypothetical protein
MSGFAKPLNASKVSGRDSLRGLYKDSLTYDNPIRFQVKWVITPPNEADALNTKQYHTLKRTELYPDDATPLALSIRLS